MASPVGDRAKESADLDQESTGDLVSAVAAQASRLVRDEIALARREMADKAKRLGRGAGLLGVAGLLAWFALGILLAAAVLGLATALPPWLSELIVALVVLIAAGVAVLVGKHYISAATPPGAAGSDRKCPCRHCCCQGGSPP